MVAYNVSLVYALYIWDVELPMTGSMSMFVFFVTVLNNPAWLQYAPMLNICMSKHYYSRLDNFFLALCEACD